MSASYPRSSTDTSEDETERETVDEQTREKGVTLELEKESERVT